MGNINNFNLFDFLPCFPWEGPPFPRGLGFRWGGISSQSLVLPTGLPGNTSPPTSSTYENIERIEFPDGFDPDSGMPNSIEVHRKYGIKAQDQELDIPKAVQGAINDESTESSSDS